MPDEQKGFWEKISQIVPHILTPLLTIILSYIFFQKSHIFNIQSKDVEFESKFHELYSQPNSRRQSPNMINGISSPCSRNQLRQGIVWDALERNIVTSKPFLFDPETSDWHLLGEVLKAMRRDDKCQDNFNHWWSEYVKGYTVKTRWPMHHQELAKLYDWIEDTYLTEIPATVGKQDGIVEWLAKLLDSWEPKGWVGTILIGFYSSVIILLILFAVHRCVLVVKSIWYYEPPAPGQEANSSQQILVQIPVYNEKDVIRQVICATAELDWPKNKLQIQILDDSTDETSAIIKETIKELRAKGSRIEHIQREKRDGYKAGALALGLQRSKADLVCIFDADFRPPKDFLRKIICHFSDPDVGMAQTRWTHINADYSLLTRLQAILLDGHFVIDQVGRYRSGCFFNFNGTAGVWRRQAIEEAGGWGTEMLTEDLDLSYRAQLKGWKFIYRPDINVPAELPINMLGFKTQQRRWSRGSLQTARKLLWQIWIAKIPLHCKFEATAHLLSNGVYTLVFMAGLLFPLIHLFHTPEHDAFVSILEISLLIIGFIAINLFQSVAKSHTNRGRMSGLLSILYVFPITMIGIGMSVNNGLAAIYGAICKGGVFVRTPKYGEDTGRHWWQSPYRGQQTVGQLLVEIAFFIYLSVFVVWQYIRLNSFDQWHKLFFPAFFALSIGYVLFMTLAHRFRQIGLQKKAI
ncbi:MAG: glycosyltransferase family 2 protein [Acidobacteriota bacterium]|nr:glycosyltransferase family 2 protein [Acidobacteriota bacterium]